MSEKRQFVPLSERIKSASGFQEENKAENEKIVSELRALYQGVFDTPEGDRLLTELIDTYLTREPQPNMSAEDIMYYAGQESVIKRIVKLSQRLEK